jgi:hypothetical protein
VHAALTGPSDGPRFDERPLHWAHDGQCRALKRFADVGDSKPAALAGIDPIELVGPPQLGQMLVSECLPSVSHRYPDDDVDAGELPGPVDAYYLMPYVFDPVLTRLVSITPGGVPLALAPPAAIAQIASAVHDYEYQACEHNEWKTSQAYAFCVALKDRLLASRPGYHTAAV